MRGSGAVRLLWLRVEIPLRACISASWECCVLSGRGLCESWSLVQRSPPTECGVSECDRKASIMRSPRPTRGCCDMTKKQPREINSCLKRPLWNKNSWPANKTTVYHVMYLSMVYIQSVILSKYLQRQKFLVITHLTHFFHVFIYLFHVSTCFERHSAHHQEIKLY